MPWEWVNLEGLRSLPLLVKIAALIIPIGLWWLVLFDNQLLAPSKPALTPVVTSNATASASGENASARVIQPNVLAPKAPVATAERIGTLHQAPVFNAPITIISANANVFAGVSDIQASETKVEVTAPNGAKTSARVYVLWQDASWQTGVTMFNGDQKVRSFLQSSLLSDKLKNAQAIACLGLSSSQQRDRGGSTAHRDKFNSDLTNRRSYVMCQLLSAETAEFRDPPRFIGLGLGYNIVQATGADELKQRALVFVAVEDAKDRHLKDDDIDALIKVIAREGAFPDFKATDYSKIKQKAELCWVSIQQGIYKPPAC